ncbi:acetyl-CoA carboxylase biotin carboxylase subunit family protein [Aeromonas caviae]
MRPTTAIFATLCYADFYSKTLIEDLRRDLDLRIIVVVDAFPDRIPAALNGHIDEIHVIKSVLEHDAFAAIDASALDEVIAKERTAHPDREIRLICCEEIILSEVGALRLKWNLAGPRDRELHFFRDKIAMKQKLARAGIKTPDFMEIDVEQIVHGHISYVELANRFGKEFILKPVDSKGSVAVELIGSDAQFQEWVKAWGETLNRVDVEQYIQGALYHVDSIVVDGKVSLQFASLYSIPPAEFKDGKVLGSITLKDNEPTSTLLKRFARDALEVLGATTMSTHMEIFLMDNEPVFLEVAARPPGAAVPPVYQMASGINILDLDLMLQLGLQLPRLEAQHGYGFWAYFPLREGVIVGLNKPHVENEHHFEWRVKVGTTVRSASNLSHTAGVVFAGGSDYESVKRDFHSVIAHDALILASR